MYIIGDVHGCLETLKALIAKLPDQNRQICFVGDLIDRGPNSRGVIDLVRSMVADGKAFCVQGNHEEMANTEIWDVRSWIPNGGYAVLPNYHKGLHDDALKIDIAWMKTLPVVLEFKDLKTDDGRYLVVSHSAVMGCTDFSDLSERDKMFIMWNRTTLRPDDFADTVYNVFGHTPHKQPVVNKVYANVDTGCCYHHIEGYGKLTALSFPDLIVYQQDYIG